MNKLILYILFVCALTSCTIRTANNTEELDNSCQDSLYAELRERDLQDSLIRESRRYINSVKGHEEKDFITGKFVDDNIDTLWFDCSNDDNRDIWELCCSNKRVKKCKFWGVSPKLVFEGDL